MKTYKAPDNSLHAIDPDFSYLLPSGCVEITEEEARAIRDANTPELAVPYSVPIRKARKALRQAGLLQAVEAALLAIPGPAGEDARDDWEYSSEVQKDNPTLILLASKLGLTEQQIDQLFITASNLP